MPMHTARAIASPLLSSLLWQMTVFRCSSAMTKGEAAIPLIEKLVICSSGKARRMPSASMTGSPHAAAATIGISELHPPISAGINASALRPMCASSVWTECTTCGSFEQALFLDCRGAETGHADHLCVVVQVREPDQACVTARPAHGTGGRRAGKCRDRRRPPAPSSVAPMAMRAIWSISSGRRLSAIVTRPRSTAPVRRRP